MGLGRFGRNREGWIWVSGVQKVGFLRMLKMGSLRVISIREALGCLMWFRKLTTVTLLVWDLIEIPEEDLGLEQLENLFRGQE